MKVEVVKGTVAQIDAIAQLFNSYRVFYGQKSDLDLAKNYIHERIDNKESVIFLATDGEGQPLGFTQLYPSFSSISAKRSWILNDLFVSEQARGAGVGRVLMNTATQHAIETGANGLSLETARDNFVAQKLYESLGYQRDNAYFSYFLSV